MGIPANGHTWSFVEGHLTLRWKGPRAPGGFWVETCFVAADGRSYVGTNQQGAKVIGTLVTDD